MARKYEIGIAADTAGFEKSIKNGLVDPLEEAEDAFDDLEQAAKDADIEKEIDKSRKAADKLEDELEDTRDALKKLGFAARDAGDDARKGMKRAEEGVSEFKDEAQQTAKEAAASFDGSAESIGDVFQEVAANAFSGFGPAGVAAGVAVAAGAGVIIDTVGKIGEAFDEAKESAFDMAYGISGALETAGVQSRMAEWSGDTEKWKQVTDLAVASGWDEIDVLTALAKGGDDLDKLTGAFADHGGQTMLTNGRLLELDGVLRGVSDGYMSAAQATEVNNRALYDYATTVGVATGEVDELGNAIVTLPDETEVAINANTQTATADIKRVEGDINAVPDSHTTTFTGRSMLDQARRDVDNFIRSQDGRSFKINGRVVTSGWDQ